MFDTAPHVLRWHADGRTGLLARLVSSDGRPPRAPAHAVSLANNAGQVLASAADPRILPLLTQAITQYRETWETPESPTGTAEGSIGTRAALVDVSPDSGSAATASGSPTVRVLVQHTRTLPDAAWTAMGDREPICLVTDLTGPELGHTTWFTRDGITSQPEADQARRDPEILRFFGRGMSEKTTRTLPDGTTVLLEALWPIPRVLVAGDGLISSALHGLAGFLGWGSQVTAEVAAAVAALDALTRSDAVIVLAHDREQAGPVLQAALASKVGYIGALGARHTQQGRAQWLVEHGVTAADLARIHGPAGLDVGARTTQEIAVSIAAEILAVRAGAGTGGQSLRDRPGPVHVDELRTSPPRYEVPPS